MLTVLLGSERLSSLMPEKDQEQNPQPTPVYVRDQVPLKIKRKKKGSVVWPNRPPPRKVPFGGLNSFATQEMGDFGCPPSSKSPPKRQTQEIVDFDFPPSSRSPPRRRQKIRKSTPEPERIVVNLDSSEED